MKYIVPKVMLKSRKNGKKVWKQLKIEKSKKQLKVVAKNFQKRHPTIVITVEYGTALNTFGEKSLFTNSMDCKSWEDLDWALTSFLDKDLWIPTKH